MSQLVCSSGALPVGESPYDLRALLCAVIEKKKKRKRTSSSGFGELKFWGLALLGCPIRGVFLTLPVVLEQWLARVRGTRPDRGPILQKNHE